MEKPKKNKLIALIPALWASVFDIGITIVHQPPGYWNGDLSQANEGNPIGAFFMANHVTGLIFISVIWLLIIGLTGYFAKGQLVKIFLLFVLIAHSYGASTWLSNHYGFWFSMVFILTNTILYVKIDRLVGGTTKPHYTLEA